MLQLLDGYLCKLDAPYNNKQTQSRTLWQMLICGNNIKLFKITNVEHSTYPLEKSLELIRVIDQNSKTGLSQPMPMEIILSFGLFYKQFYDANAPPGNRGKEREDISCNISWKNGTAFRYFFLHAVSKIFEIPRLNVVAANIRKERPERA